MKEWVKSPHLIWWILLVATLIRCGYAIMEPLNERDADIYRENAHNLASGKGYTRGGRPEIDFPPVPPVMMAAIYKLGGGERACREWWAMMGVALVAVAWTMVKERHGLAAANLAALGVAFYPYNIVMGGSTSTEIPNLTLIFLTLLFVARWWRTAALRDVVLAGVCQGLAILTRPAGTAFVPLLVVAVAVFPRIAFGRRALAVALLVVTTLAVLAPWSIRTSRLTGTVAITSGAGPRSLWWGTNPHVLPYHYGEITKEEFARRTFEGMPDPWGNNVEFASLSQSDKDRIYMDRFKQFVREEPGTFLRVMLYKSIEFWQMPGAIALATKPPPPHVQLTRIVGWLTWTPLCLLTVLGLLRLRWTTTGIYLAWIGLAFVTNVWFTAFLRYRFATGVDNLMIVIAAVYLARFLDEQVQ